MIAQSLELRGQRCLFVASTGGHLTELDILARDSGADPSSLWLTFDTPQSRSIVKGRPHLFVDYVPPRGYKQLLASARPIRRLMSENQFDVVVSTGASLAVVPLAMQRAKRRRAVYVETVSRFDGPSLTGKIVSQIPGVQLVSQHERWARGEWAFLGNVLDDVATTKPPFPAQSQSHIKIFVTLGTIQPYRFDRLINHLLSVVPEGVSITWQSGCTTRDDLPGQVVDEVGLEAVTTLIQDADLVISHGGVGTALLLASMNKPFILIPRRGRYGEHVDDHQEQLCSDFAERSICRTFEADEFSWSDLCE